MSTNSRQSDDSRQQRLRDLEDLRSKARRVLDWYRDSISRTKELIDKMAAFYPDSGSSGPKVEDELYLLLKRVTSD